MSFSSILSTMLILLLVCGGCTPEAHRYIRFPRLFSPGPASYQRAEAVRHDPYPLNDVGPEIVGGRPLAYQQPVNEVERARMAAPRPVPSGPLVAPSWPTQPPPAVAPSSGGHEPAPRDASADSHRALHARATGDT